MAGSGTTTVAVGATLTISGGVSLDTRTLSNSGTLNISGLNTGLFFYNTAVLNNQAGGTLNSQNDQTLSVQSGSPAITNAGTFSKTGGAGNTGVNVPLTNTGTVQAQSGTLALQGGSSGAGAYSAASGAVLDFNNGSYSLGAGSSVGGAGTIRFSTGATTTVAGSYAVAGTTEVTNGTANFNSSQAMTTGALNITGGTANFNGAAGTTAATLTLTGGTLAGTGNLTLSGASTWSNATMGGTGTTAVNSGVTLTISSGVTLDTRTLNNAGTINLTGPNTWTFANGAVFNNQSGATLNSQADQAISPSGTGTPVINNTGTFSKTGGTGTSTVGVSLNNNGHVEPQSGTLSLAGNVTGAGSYFAASGAVLGFDAGTVNFNSGSAVSGVGTVRFSTSSAVTINGTYTVAGTTLITNGAVSFNSSQAMTTGNLNITGGTASLDSAQSFTAAALAMSGGTLTGNGPFVLSGPGTWSGGTMAGTGATTTIPTGVVLTVVTTNSGISLIGRTLNNAGTINWTAGSNTWSFQGAATLNNQAGASLNSQADQNFTDQGGGQNVLSNAGTFAKTGGNGTTILGIALTNTGTVQAQSGTLSLRGGVTSTSGFTIAAGATLDFNGGTANLNAGTTVTNAGSVSFTGGTHNLNSTSGVTGAGSVIISGATVNATVNMSMVNLELAPFSALAGNGTLTISSTFLWTGGTQMSAGVGSTVIAAGATLTITNAAQSKSLDNRTLSNAGTINWTGGQINLSSAAILSNTNIFNIQTDDPFSGFASTLANTGTITKSSPTGIGATLISTLFNNTGTANIASGVLQIQGGGTSTGAFNAAAGATFSFNGGNHTLNGAAFTGAGFGSVDGATVTVNGAVAAESFALTAGTLTGPGTLTASGALRWTGGAQTGTGITQLAASATLSITGLANNKSIDNRSLNLAGTTNWDGGELGLSNAAIMTNTGTFNILIDANIVYQGGNLPRFDNNGTVNKTSPFGTGTTRISTLVNNSGTIKIGGTLDATLELAGSGDNNHSGTFNVFTLNSKLLFTAGTHFLNSATISGPGQFIINGATLVTTGTVQTQNVQLNNGALRGSGTIGGTISVGQGTLSAGNNVPATLNTGAVSLSASAQFQTFIGGTAPGTGYSQVVAAGTVNLANANLVISVLNNFVPQTTDVFKIIDIGQNIALQGTFNGLPEGAQVFIGGVAFNIHYINGVQIGGLEVSSQVLLVRDLPTNTVLMSSKTTAQIGEPVTFTATISSNFDTPNAGTVSFLDGGNEFSVQPVANGTAAVTVSTLTQGSHSITATYSGTAVFKTSTSTAVTIQIGALAPVISSFLPNSGNVGTPVTILGSHFTGATSVTFNGVASTNVVVNSPTQITATVPAGATSGAINVTTSGGTGTSGANLFFLPPIILGYSPVGGTIGSQVVITGTSFNNANAVAFGGVATSAFTVDSPTQITVTVPVGAKTGPIGVSTPGGEVASTTNFYPPPTITGFAPAAGAVGNQIVITGTNFTNANAVAFNGTATSEFTVDSATQITVTVPPGATTGPIGVSAPVPGLIGTSTGSFTVLAPLGMAASATGAAGQFPSGIAVGDFNGDLKADAAVVNYAPRFQLPDSTYTTGDSVSVLLGTGAGGFSQSTTINLPAGTSPFGVAVGKFNTGTNKLSIVTGNFKGQSIGLILGNGDGTFKSPVMLPAADAIGGLHKIVQVTVGLVNGDNHQDIVAASGDGTYTVFLGNGDGTFAPLPSRSALTPIFGIAIATFDTGTGPKPGLVVAAFAANKIGVLPGNGDGTFQAPIFTNENGITNEFVGADDFNKDGKADVATTNKDSNNVSVLLGNGNGTFSSVATFATGQRPLGMAVSDVNNDGNKDLVVANIGGDSASAGSIAVLLGDAAGSFAAAQTFGAGPYPIAVAAGDFTLGEGTPSIVATNFYGSQRDAVILANKKIPALPIITAFTPGGGPVGSQIVIFGANFLNVNAVAFNGLATPNFVVNSPTQITVFVPTGATTGPIGISNQGGIGVSAVPFIVT